MSKPPVKCCDKVSFFQVPDPESLSPKVRRSFPLHPTCEDCHPAGARGFHPRNHGILPSGRSGGFTHLKVTFIGLEATKKLSVKPGETSGFESMIGEEFFTPKRMVMMVEFGKKKRVCRLFCSSIPFAIQTSRNIQTSLAPTTSDWWLLPAAPAHLDRLRSTCSCQPSTGTASKEPARSMKITCC